MKIIGRTLVLLAAALIVVGITFAFVGSNTATSTGRPRQNSVAQGQPSGSPATSMQSGRGDFRGGPERGNGGSAGLFGLLEVGKNLVIMAVIVAFVAPLSHLLRKRKERAPKANNRVQFDRL